MTRHARRDRFAFVVILDSLVMDGDGTMQYVGEREEGGREVRRIECNKKVRSSCSLLLFLHSKARREGPLLLKAPSSLLGRKIPAH